tara:strand:- start:1427 stop:1846 length:420 start_codon:yes stop_codon:yes gene_type:complete
MPSVGKVNGTQFGVFVNNTLIAFSTSCSINISQETMNVTTANTGDWNSRTVSRRDWEISCSALMSFDSSVTNKKFFEMYSDYISAQSIVTIKFKTNVSGDKFFTGDAILTELSLDAPNEETATFSASFVAAGPLFVNTN